MGCRVFPGIKPKFSGSGPSTLGPFFSYSQIQNRPLHLGRRFAERTSQLVQFPGTQSS
jgi:hypothetical protein